MKFAQTAENIKPLCPVFGQCGGCNYQNISYEQELQIKNSHLKEILKDKITETNYQDIISSPQEYFYRHRIDLKLVRTKSGKVLIGFSPQENGPLIPIETCYIARAEVAGFISRIKNLVMPKLTSKYRQANLVIKTGDDSRVLWGGVGRRTLHLTPDQYLWTKIHGRKIFYSLDTFFQANLSILTPLIDTIRQFNVWDKKPLFLDLYGGVGLFSVGLYDLYSKGFLIENVKQSIELAKYNQSYHKLNHLEIIEGCVEDKLTAILENNTIPTVAMIDPPRAGLTPMALNALLQSKNIDHLLYLSCHPESLNRDLSALTEKWQIEKIIPFDFFPKTKHLETLVVLTQPKRKGA